LPRYTSQGIVYHLLIAVAAKQDLAAIGAEDPETEAEILALLQELKGNQLLLASLTVKDFGLAREAKFHVDVWARQQNKGRNLWRLKIWSLEDYGLRYRVIYALDPRKSQYYILAILHRDFDYDEKHPRVQQLLASYDRLGVPTYR
jgi:hypothetical protein